MGSSNITNKVLKGSGKDGEFLKGLLDIINVITVVVILIGLVIIYFTGKSLFKWFTKVKYTDTITVKDKQIKGNYVSGYVYLIFDTNKNVYVVSKFDYERININDTFTAVIEDKNEDLLYIRKIQNFTL